MKKLFLVLIVGLALFLAACTSKASQTPSTNILEQTATDQPSPVPTQTALPTSTATVTPEPTATPTPPVESPAKVKEVLDGVNVVRTESFKETSSQLIDYGTGVTAAGDGTLNMVGTTFWNSSFTGKNQFSEGSGVVFSYKYSPQTEFEVFLDIGNWGTPEYRRFGVYAANIPAADLFQGSQGLGFNYLSSNFGLKTDTWYTILITVGKGGDFLTLIWDPAKPEHVARYREVIKKWENNQWNLKVGANNGKIQFKDYMEITFSGFKK